MPTRSPFQAISTEEIQQLGGDVVPLVHEMVAERAAAHDLPIARAARRLPDGWRDIVLAAQVLEDIEEAECLAGAFVEVRKLRDVLALEAFFDSIGARKLARALERARESTCVLEAEDMDPLEIDELVEVTASELELRRVRAAVAERARAMAVPFPAEERSARPKRTA